MMKYLPVSAVGQFLAFSGETWPTADTGKYFIIPDMLKSLMNGAPFQSTVAAANAQLQTVLNTGAEG